MKLNVRGYFSLNSTRFFQTHNVPTSWEIWWPLSRDCWFYTKCPTRSAPLNVYGEMIIRLLSNFLWIYKPMRLIRYILIYFWKWITSAFTGNGINCLMHDKTLYILCIYLKILYSFDLSFLIFILSRFGVRILKKNLIEDWRCLTIQCERNQLDLIDHDQ